MNIFTYGMSQMINDLVFLSLEDWNDIWRRNQFICATWAGRHPEMKIIFVSLPHDVSNRIRRLKFGGLGHDAVYAVPGFPNITVLHPYKLLPNSIGAGRRFNEGSYRRAVTELTCRLGIKEFTLWVNAHWAGHCVGRLGEAACIYDVTDDWMSLTQSAQLVRLIEQQDRELCERASAVIVCSKKLRDMKMRITPAVHLIPNGVDANHYAGVLEDSKVRDNTSPPAERTDRRSVFGYTGTVHPDRVDLDLITELAKRNTGADFVFLGPLHLGAKEMQRLRKLSNIRLMGPVPYADIPRAMQTFDVCMTPHRMTASTESLNPIKLWEYLAAGKPIVSTDVAGFRDYPDHVRIARTVDDFEAALWAAELETRSVDRHAKAMARQAEARKHSWESRVDQIEEVIRNCVRTSAVSQKQLIRIPEEPLCPI